MSAGRAPPASRCTMTNHTRRISICRSRAAILSELFFQVVISARSDYRSDHCERAVGRGTGTDFPSPALRERARVRASFGRKTLTSILQSRDCHFDHGEKSFFVRGLQYKISRCARDDKLSGLARCGDLKAREIKKTQSGFDVFSVTPA